MYNPDFSQPWHFSDVVLSVEGAKFHVHKSTLSMWSPVFEKMFTSDFAEKNAKEIELPGKKAREVEVLLNVVYTNGRGQKITGKVCCCCLLVRLFCFVFYFTGSSHSSSS